MSEPERPRTSAPSAPEEPPPLGSDGAWAAHAARDGGSRAALGACVALVVLAALAIYRGHGTDTLLLHDDAIFAYGGQRLLDGVPPYVSIFDHKGPLTTILCGLGAWLGRLAGVDSLVAMRWLFLVLGLGAAAGVTLLAHATLRSTRAALFAGAMFAAYPRFGYHAAGGPRPKVAVVLFEVLAFLLAARGRWYGAAFAAGLAGLVWQPTGSFALAVLLAAAFGPPPGRRLSALARAAAGVATPLVATALWFRSKGAFGELWEGAVRFNLVYLEDPAGLRRTLHQICEAIFVSNTGLGFAILLGLFALGLVFVARAGAVGARRALFAEPISVVFLALPFPLAWSLVDFQGAPDFFVFLPFASLGFAWVLEHAMAGVERELAPRGRARLARLACTALPTAVFLGGGFFVAHYYEVPGLAEQRAEVRRIFAGAPDSATWVSIGAPQAMVLAERVDPTRYGFLMRGIDRLIEDTEPGGFDGWVASLGEPDGGVLVGRIALRSIGAEQRARLEAWLERFELDQEASQSWLVYRPPGGSGPD